VLTEWGSLIPGLNAGRFDIITAGMYITPKRCKNVAFTDPMGVFAEASSSRPAIPWASRATATSPRRV
jgi:polar amino acid transport system substrate-binding protein